MDNDLCPYSSDGNEVGLNEDFPKRSYLAGPNFIIFCDEIPSKFQDLPSEAVCIRGYDDNPTLWTCKFNAVSFFT